MFETMTPQDSVQNCPPVKSFLRLSETPAPTIFHRAVNCALVSFGSLFLVFPSLFDNWASQVARW